MKFCLFVLLCFKIKSIMQYKVHPLIAPEVTNMDWVYYNISYLAYVELAQHRIV